MTQTPRAGAVHWIDHFVVPVNNMLPWERFMEDVLGGTVHHRGGLSSAEMMRGGQVRTFYNVGHHEIGGFLQPRLLPPTDGPGSVLPRWGFYVRPEHIDTHRRRFDEHQVNYREPTRTSEDGEEGISLLFEDVDGNQYELWAPDRLPAGAMESDNPLGMGRISHVVQESRDLDRTADFYARFCGLEPIENADVAEDTLVLGLAGGGRMIFKKVDHLSARTGGHSIWGGMHTALTVRAEEYADSYERIWSGLPEIAVGAYSLEHALADQRDLRAHTEPHGHQARGERGAKPGQRGRDFLDDDYACYHLTAGRFRPGDVSSYSAVSAMEMDA